MDSCTYMYMDPWRLFAGNHVYLHDYVQVYAGALQVIISEKQAVSLNLIHCALYSMVIHTT